MVAGTLVARTFAFAAVAVLCMAAAPTAGATPTDTPEQVAAQRLADEYAPILEIRRQSDPPCESSAEQYLPTSARQPRGHTQDEPFVSRRAWRPWRMQRPASIAPEGAG